MLIIILTFIFLMYLLCWIYCLYRKHKSAFKGLDSYRAMKSIEKNSCGQLLKDSAGRKIVNFIYKLIDSILRFSLFVTSYIPSHHIRNFLYRFVYRISMGKNVVIYYGAEIRSPWNLYISDGSIIGDKCILDARSGIYIGKNVNFSSEAAVWTLQHNVNAPDFSTAGEGKPVYIFDRVWVSTRAVVLPGCVLNEGSVIAGGGIAQKIQSHLEYMVGFPARRLVLEI